MIFCLNERDYLRNCVHSLLGWVDKIYICESATEFAPLHKNGLSVDGTGDIAGQLVSEYRNKIEYIPYGLSATRLEAQNFIGQKIKVGDLIIHSGADMIWYPDNNFRKYMEDNHDVGIVYPDIWDMIAPNKHYNNSKDATPPFRATICWRKIDEGMRYQSADGAVSGAGRDICDYNPKWSLEENIGLRYIHCSCICSRQKYLLKRVHIIMQNDYMHPWASLNLAQRREVIEQAYLTDPRMSRICGNKDDSIFGLPIYPIAPADLPPAIQTHPYFKYENIWDIPQEQIYDIEKEVF